MEKYHIFNIDQFDQYFVSEPNSEDALDVIFGWRRLSSREVVSDSFINTQYNYPAHLKYYFSTIKDPDINENLLVLHSNNIPVSITHRLSLIQEKELAKVVGHNETVNGVSGWCKEGVWIVEYYNLDNAIAKGHKDAIKYLTECSYIYKNNDKLNMQIKDYVAMKANQKVQLSRYFKYPDIKIRIVSFIPKEKILEHIRLRINDLNIMINLGELDPNIRYREEIPPRSIIKPDLTLKHSVNYEIVNNEDSDFPKFVYTVSGNEVLKLPVCQILGRKSGCYISRYINGVCATNEYSTLDDMEKTFGIYRTEEDAKFAGDPAKQLEFGKLNVEREKIDANLRELDFKRYDIRNKRFLSTVELDKKREEWMYNTEKMKLELEIYKAKTIAEYRILSRKLMQETTKSEDMSLSTYFNIALQCLKLLK